MATTKERTRYTWIYDIESLSNFFCLVAKYEDTIRIFEISYRKNDFTELKDFLLNEVEELGGYNCLAYDSQIVQYILKARTLTGPQIYEFSQKVIESEKPIWWEGKLTIPHRDIFKINHWDNAAKSSSLKWIEYSLDLNIEDMPIHHSHEVFSSRECDDIIKYCINDVVATEEIFYRSKEQIELRETLSNQFGLNLKNKSETSLAKEIILSKIADALKINKEKLRKMRTLRTSISGNTIIPEIIKFEDKRLQKVYKYMYGHDFIKDFKYEIDFKGLDLTYGKGGIHGCTKSGHYKSTDEFVIKSFDVTSLYPFIIMNFGYVPEHLDKETFLPLYRWFFDERKKYNKKHVLNLVWKLCLNSFYGSMGDENSFSYDFKQVAATCVTGQLLLSMLMERLSCIPDSKFLMMNTDGGEIMIPRKYCEEYDRICKEWEVETSLMLEHFEYSDMMIRDVNWRRNLVNCWNNLTIIKLQHKDEISLSVNA